MNCHNLKTQTGYSLFELVAVIIIVGIIVSVAVRGLRKTDDVAKVEETKAELEQLAYAVGGDPDLTSGGVRTDFGYVGDIGALPINLDGLVTNPGYGTWDGPYIQDDFLASTSGTGSEFKYDGWGKEYSYSAAAGTITSTGGSTSISRKLAKSVSHLVSNDVTLVIADLDNSPPGPNYCDSVQVNLTYPNGSGSTTTSSKNPGSNGWVSFSSVPVGHHDLKVIYIPDNDTLARTVVVYPGVDYYVEITLPVDHW